MCGNPLELLDLLGQEIDLPEHDRAEFADHLGVGRMPDQQGGGRGQRRQRVAQTGAQLIGVLWRVHSSVQLRCLRLWSERCGTHGG